MRRLTNIFGGSTVGPLGGGFGKPGGWETNTLVSDLTTVICLDDYHLNDRGGRKVSGRTALHTAEQRFDLMAEQLAALKVRIHVHISYCTNSATCTTCVRIARACIRLFWALGSLSALHCCADSGL
jgi:Phosphoribulokinase / Uridine kinase family